MSVDLRHVNRGTHETTGDPGLPRSLQGEIGGKLKISGLKAVGMIIAQSEPPLSTPDFEAEPDGLTRYATADVGGECRARARLSKDANVIGSLTDVVTADVEQSHNWPKNFCLGI